MEKPVVEDKTNPDEALIAMAGNSDLSEADVKRAVERVSAAGLTPPTVGSAEIEEAFAKIAEADSGILERLSDDPDADSGDNLVAAIDQAVGEPVVAPGSASEELADKQVLIRVTETEHMRWKQAASSRALP